MRMQDAKTSDRFRLIDGEWWYYYGRQGKRHRAMVGVCKHCGESWVRGKTNASCTYEFCGPECHYEHQREKRPVVHCDTCGTKISRNPQDIRRVQHHYCSRRCSVEGRRGAGTKNFKGYISRHSGGYLKFTDRHPEHPGKLVHNVKWHNANPDGVCERCGAGVDHVHHRDGDKLNNDLDNLEGLCATCHARHHLKERYAA